jgi:surface antigen
MRTSSRFQPLLLPGLLAACALAVAVPVNVYAQPPSHAPAHGWRKKHDPYYVGYTGKRWERDYGIVTGRCNREAIGAVLGGVVGGAVGAQVGQGDTRPVAIVIGTIAGAVIGASIGRNMDEADRACIGHALELAGNNTRVSWRSGDGATTYELTPTRGYTRGGRQCREFDLRATSGGQRHDGKGQACQTAEGTWQISG